MAEKRYFIRRDENGNESGVLIGYQLRQAALKEAHHSDRTKQKPVEIRLKKEGTKKVNNYKGWKELVLAQTYRPEPPPPKEPS